MLDHCGDDVCVFFFSLSAGVDGANDSPGGMFCYYDCGLEAGGMFFIRYCELVW